MTWWDQLYIISWHGDQLYNVSWHGDQLYVVSWHVETSYTLCPDIVRLVICCALTWWPVIHCALPQWPVTRTVPLHRDDLLYNASWQYCDQLLRSLLLTVFNSLQLLPTKLKQNLLPIFNTQNSPQICEPWCSRFWIVSICHHQFWQIRMRPHGCWLSFFHCPAVAHITVSSDRLRFSLNDVDCCCDM